MSKPFTFALVNVAALLLIAGAAHAAGDPAAGQTKAAACTACHGADGNSTNPQFPTLAGQVPGYIAKQLADFKSGARKNAIMNGIAAGLSQQDMADLDAYYANAERKEGVATNPDLVALGEHIYRGGNAKTGVSACMSCHGPAGGGIPPRFPSVAGQLPDYAERQLLAFKRGERSNDAEIMTRIAFRMSEKEIKAVAQYMYALR